MKRLLIVVLMLSSLSGTAQMSWFIDMEVAKEVAVQQKKFILVDFWATWCGPCKVMDREMWMSSEINEYASKFVPLKIDVDQNRDLAAKYGARSIPMVVIIDPMGNEIWKEIGYSSSAPYFRMLDNIPASSLPAEAVKLEQEDKGDPETWMTLAMAYQKMAKAQTYTKLQMGMLSESDQYLKNVAKKSSDQETLELAELHQILNDAYRGRTKAALKKVAKLDGDNSELSNYIQAYCYKCMGNTSEMEKYKKMIKNKELLAQLE